MEISRSIFITLFLVLSLLTYGQQVVKHEVKDKLSVSKSVEIKGYVGDKLNASYKNRILAQDVDKLLKPFTVRDEHSCWQSEFWGKWFTSAVLAYRYSQTPTLSNKLKEAFNGLIETQSVDGYIGNYAPESRLNAWDIWGRKYCMLGLIAYYDITKETAALKAASKEADLLMWELENKSAKIIEMGNHRGMAASSVLEPICQLYNRTGNKKYLDFAEEIVVINKPDKIIYVQDRATMNNIIANTDSYNIGTGYLQAGIIDSQITSMPLHGHTDEMIIVWIKLKSTKLTDEITTFVDFLTDSLNNPANT